jgi:hypothetical protein
VVLAGDEGSRPPIAFGAVRIQLDADRTPGAFGFQPQRVPPEIDSSGAFKLGEFGDVLPGSYRLVVHLPADAEPGRGWSVASVTADGRDILDAPLVIDARRSDDLAVVVTLTTVHASLSGVLDPGTNARSGAYTVLVFSTNHEWWREPFRRVRAARPSTRGQFAFDDLPPGEYYVAAMTDVVSDAWRDPSFLDGVAAIAIRISIAPGEHRVQNLRIGG